MHYREDPWHPPSPASLQRLQATCPGSQPESGRNPVCRIRGEDLLLMPFEHLTSHLLHNGKETATLSSRRGCQFGKVCRLHLFGGSLVPEPCRTAPSAGRCWKCLPCRKLKENFVDLINFLPQKLFCTSTMCRPLHVTIFLPLRSLYSLVLISLIGGDKQ